MEYGLTAYEYREIGPEDAAGGAGNKKTVDGGRLFGDPREKRRGSGTSVCKRNSCAAEVEDSTPVRILMREDEEAKFQTEVPDAVEAPVRKAPGGKDRLRSERGRSGAVYADGSSTDRGI